MTDPNLIRLTLRVDLTVEEAERLQPTLIALARTREGRLSRAEYVLEEGARHMNLVRRRTIVKSGGDR